MAVPGSETSEIDVPQRGLLPYGLVDTVGDEKRRGTEYRLTEKGRRVLECLEILVDAVRS